jgi:hypothetical protein
MFNRGMRVSRKDIEGVGTLSVLFIIVLLFISLGDFM